MSDPHRLRRYDEVPRVDRHRRARGLRRLWLRLRFDPRVREMCLVALAMLIACLLTAASPDSGNLGPGWDAGSKHATHTVSNQNLSPEDVYWLTR